MSVVLHRNVERPRPIRGGRGRIATAISTRVGRPAALEIGATQSADDFDAKRLGRQWRWRGNPREEWFSLTARPGWLRLYPQLSQLALDQQQNLLLRKLSATRFAVETVLAFHPMQWGEEAGLIFFGESWLAVGLNCDGLRTRVVLRIHDKLRILNETSSSTLRIRLAFDREGKCSFGVEGNDRLVASGQKVTSGDGPSRRIGLYSVKRLANSPAGRADFDYFRFV